MISWFKHGTSSADYQVDKDKKYSPCACQEAIWEGGGLSLFILNFDQMGICGHASAAASPGITPLHPGLVWAVRRWDKILASTGNPTQTSRTSSPCFRHYTGWLIAAPTGLHLWRLQPSVSKDRVAYWRFKWSCYFHHQGRRLPIKPDWWCSRFL